MHRWLAVMLLFSGCAFGLSAPDPDRPRSQPPKCDTGKGLVALDGAMAITSGVIAMSIAGDTEPAVALLPLSIGAIYVAGAVRGNSNVNKCRKAMGEYEDYLASRETLPSGQPELVDDQASEEDREARPRLSARAPVPQAASQSGGPPAPTTLSTRPAAPQPPAAADPAPAPAQAPAAPAPVAKPAAKPAPPPPAEDDWSDFWREVEP